MSSLLSIESTDHACRLCSHFMGCTHWVIQDRPWCGVGAPDELELVAPRANSSGVVTNCGFFIHKDYCNW